MQVRGTAASGMPAVSGLDDDTRRHPAAGLDPVTCLGSANAGEAGADDIGAGLTGLDHAGPLIGQPGGRHGAPRHRHMPGPQ
jgi:hypothetical protein